MAVSPRLMATPGQPTRCHIIFRSFAFFALNSESKNGRHRSSIVKSSDTLSALTMKTQEQEISFKDASIFSQSATIYRDFDAAAAILDSTIAALKKDEDDEMLIKRCSSFAEDDEDDDLSEELEHLETSKHVLWEELNVSELDLSAITTESVELHFFGDCDDYGEDVITPTKRNMTMDTQRLLAESERLIDIVMEESSSSVQKTKILPPTQDEFTSNKYRTSVPFQVQPCKKRTLDSKVRISEDLNTYFSPTNIQEEQKGEVSLSFPKENNQTIDMIVDGNKEENGSSCPEQARNNGDTNDKENQEAGNTGRRKKGKNLSKGWLNLPKKVGFCVKRKQNEEDPIEGPSGLRLIASVPEEGEEVQDKTLSQPSTPRERKIAAEKQLINVIDGLTTEGGILRPKREENSANRSANLENTERINTGKRTRTTEEVDSIVKSNKKLKRQRKKFLKMLTDAWNEKLHTEEMHEKQVKHIAEKMQQKVTEAKIENQKLVLDNHILKMELEDMKKNQTNDEQNLDYQAILDWKRRLESEMQDKYALKESELQAKFAEKESEMQTKYTEKLEQEITYRMVEQMAKQKTAEAELKQINQELKEKCEEQGKVLTHLKSVLRSTVTSNGDISPVTSGHPIQIIPFANSQTMATEGDTQSAVTSGYFTLLDQAHQEQNSGIQVLEECQAAQVQHQLGTGKPARRKGRGLRLRPLQENVRTNRFPDQQKKKESMPPSSSKENIVPLLFAVRRRNQEPASNKFMKARIPTFHRRNNSAYKNVRIGTTTKSSILF